MSGSLASTLADTLADGGWRAKARPEQLAPPGDWNGWALIAGRGFGKTRTGAEWIIENVMNGTARDIALVAPTAEDARKVMVNGVAGIMTVAPSWARPTFENRQLTWPNGAIATLFTAEAPERLRGPQHDCAWADEAGAWANAEETWDMLSFGLRLGVRPRWLVTTTPKPTPLLRKLLKRRDVVITRGSTFDNAANLAPPFLQTIRERYEGTRLGRQELFAEMLEDTPGALFSRDLLDKTRIPTGGEPEELSRIVVGVDPAATANEDSDLTGIVVAAVDYDGHGYVLADNSIKASPSTWAKTAVSAYHRYKADIIVAESNNGGDMVQYTISSVDRNVPVKLVHASRGKQIRAQPISSFFEQGRAHLVGHFPQLEDQMCSFAPGTRSSPDRLDAMVWALTELMAAPMAKGQGLLDLARAELAEWRSKEPEPIRSEFAKGSVEWQRAQGSTQGVIPQDAQRP